MAETPAQKRKRIEKRNRYRKTVCRGCRYNHYNWPHGGDGWDGAVERDSSCWHLDEVKRGKCWMHTGQRR